eukprot:TRINITY_DN9450_c0_g1_i1.p1 TRINITY_DN9450_c0_g1~~TRINITY_DN9450_c0_g1_i1.p1  ORF type:complete len:427 (-),score=97.33 TRINITY_DN9450_c0_g1_i1:13-1293(-)
MTEQSPKNQSQSGSDSETENNLPELLKELTKARNNKRKKELLEDLLQIVEEDEGDDRNELVKLGLKPILDIASLGDLTIEAMTPEDLCSAEIPLLRTQALQIIEMLCEDGINHVSIIEQGAAPILFRFVFYGKPNPERSSAIGALFFLSENAVVREELLSVIRAFEGDWKKVIANILEDYVTTEERDWFIGILKFLEYLPTPGMVKPGKAYYNNLEDFPFVKALEEKFPLIKEEFLALKQNYLVAWPEKYLCEKGWDVFGLFAFQNKIENNCAVCPETTKILESIPGMVTCMFSCLQPKTHIKPHVGYYQYSEKILRCHLGVVVPPGCALKVNGTVRSWEEGKCFIFDDTFMHEAWNRSKVMRVVLMIDFMFDRNEQRMTPERVLSAEEDTALISKDLLDTLNSMGTIKNVKERPNALGYVPKIQT